MSFNNTGKILTVSIAGYNVGKYICKALDSILDERIIEDIQVIVVDDGGTDNTMELVETYVKRYPDTVLPIHKQNGGYGSVVNTSIQYANGKYFKQLDGDDWFETENFIKFIEVLRENDADIFVTGTEDYYELHNTTQVVLKHDYLQNGKYKIEDVDFQNLIGMHMVAIRTSILQDNGIKITEGCFYCDVELASFPIKYAETIYFWNSPVYVYRIGRSGQSVSVNSMQKHYKEHELVLDHLIDLYKSIDPSNISKRKLMRFRIRREISQQFKFLCCLPKNHKVVTEMRCFYNKIMKEDPLLIKEAKKYSNTCNLLINSRFLLYPIVRRHYISNK